MLFLIITCSKKETEAEKPLNERLNFSHTEYQETLKSKLLSADSSLIKMDSFFQYYDTLKTFYASRNFEPVFINSFEDNELIYSVLIILENAEEHGLNLEQYHHSKIINEFKSATDTLPNADRYTNLANAELLLSDAVVKYSKHLRYGVVNPKNIFVDSYFIPLDDSSKGDLLQPLKEENIPEFLTAIQPQSKRYKQLQSALKYYNSFKDIEWVNITSSEKKIELGSGDYAIPLIAKRLIDLEYIDTSSVSLGVVSVYDTLLMEYVKKFQRDQGLNDDGVIGRNTLERLNTTPQEYISKIKVNLERFRWNDYPDTSDYILVNIPDFMLFINEGGEEIYKTKVCTGIKRPAHFAEKMTKYKKTKSWKDKPDDWETPNLYGEISYLVLNPTWNVPQSIMREEIVYKMSRDSSYLRNHNFKVYHDTAEVNPDDIKVSDLSVEKIPYRIVQDPGAGNALGKIKFIFNNPFGIYLHDTPNRPPFKNSNRAVSHGCIRVEYPIPVAQFLLRSHTKWNIDYLKIEIGLKVEEKSVVLDYAKKRESLRKFNSLGATTDVTLPKKVPLYVDYYTAWVDENGVVNFREDVYQRDRVLLEYLTINQLI